MARPDQKVDRFSTKTVDAVEAGRIAERHYDRLRFAQEFGIPLDQKTFRWVSERWYEGVIASKLNERDKANFRGILDRYLLPFFGDKVISLLKTRDVAEYRKWRREYWLSGPGKDVTGISYAQQPGRVFILATIDENLDLRLEGIVERDQGEIARFLARKARSNSQEHNQCQPAITELSAVNDNEVAQEIHISVEEAA